MKQIFLKNGGAVVEQVPAPEAAPGEVLVCVDRSCISVGTEMSGLKSTGEPIWKRALKRPDKVIKALNMMATRGVDETMNIVRGQINAGLVVGYSAAGRVVSVGKGVQDFEVGDRVACAGAQAAHHAELIRVPTNLCVTIPQEVSFDDAATVTLGAIAMQGVRRAEPTLGEAFVVVGLGLLGQLTVQILKSNGCQVIGIDVDDSRLRRAQELGLDIAIKAGAEAPIKEVARLTRGVGVDGVIVTAASPDPDVLANAFKLCRRKGRVVLVGDVPISIDRADIYRNEIDFRISTSYGPGRYDRSYEEEGLDYPVSYVRWTENRNMQAYLQLIAANKVTPSKLIDKVYPVDEAGEAYQSLKNSDQEKPLAILISYESAVDSIELLKIKKVVVSTGLAKKKGPIQVGVAGPGGFLLGVHLPNMSSLEDMFQIRGIMSRTSHVASSVAMNQRAAYATTDYNELLADSDVDMILIGTRHDTHGEYVLRALEAGKHVLVEKPLALKREELAAIEDFYATSQNEKPLLLTGFNRRFSPALTKLKAMISDRREPMVINYRMNAGRIPLDHWVHGSQGGGRNLGEACHIYDLFTALTGARVTSVQATAVSPTQNVIAGNDNFVATMKFEDGSIATLTYTALGDTSWPKEQMDLYCEQKVYCLDDYVKLSCSGMNDLVWSGGVDKGHKTEIIELANAIQKGNAWPIQLWEQVQATEIAMQVEEAIAAVSKHDLSK